MRYHDCIFDLYGTLVDIRTDETRPRLWEELAAWYRENGAAYEPEELKEAYFRELLKALRANGQRVWLLSNAQSIFTRCELSMLGIEKLFDGIYLSSDYGCKKPDRRFFELLLRERGIAPENAIMIGNDGVCDIQGARAVGLSALYVRSNISPEEPLPEADYVLEEMDLGRVREILTGK